jgi:hypothetical protein
MTRREFTKAHKAEMLRRAMDEKGRVHCEGCGLDVTGKAIEFDHTIPEAMVTDKSRPLTAADGSRASGIKKRMDGTVVRR